MKKSHDDSQKTVSQKKNEKVAAKFADSSVVREASKKINKGHSKAFEELSK